MKKIKAGVKKSLSLLIIIGLLLAYLPEGATFGKDTGVAGDPIPLALSQQEIKDPVAAPAKAPAKEGRPKEAATASDKKAGTKDRAALLRLQKVLKEEADRTFDGDGDAYFSGLSLKAKSPKGPTGKVKIIQGDKGYFALDLKGLQLEKTDQIHLQLDPSIELVTSYYGQDKQAELTALLDRLDSDILSDSSEAREDVDKVKAIKPDYALEEEGLALDKESAEEGTNGLKSYALSPEKADLESARLLFYAKAPVENPPVNLQIDQAGKTYTLSLEDASSADKNQSQAEDPAQDPADPAMSAEAEQPAKEINPEKDLSDLITPTEGETSVLLRSSHEHDDSSNGCSVRKVWRDGKEKHSSKSVTVKVYLSGSVKVKYEYEKKRGKWESESKKIKIGEILYTETQLMADNNWQQTFSENQVVDDERVKKVVYDFLKRNDYRLKKISPDRLSWRFEEIPVEGYEGKGSWDKYKETFTITNTPTSPTPPTPPAQGTQVKVKKMIDYLGDGAGNPDTKVAGKEDYRQYLEFTGQEPEQQEQGYDFLIAVDTTRSMKRVDYKDLDGSDERRDVIANRLLNGGDDGSSSEYGLLTKLLKANPEKNKACVMTFVGKGSRDRRTYDLNTQTDVLYDWQSLEKKSKADYVNVLYDEKKKGGGTNYCTPLYRAAQLFNSVAGDGNKKVLIFITDGEPNESVSKYDSGSNTVTISRSEDYIKEDNRNAYGYLQSKVGALDFHSIAIKIDKRNLSELRDLTNTAVGTLHLADDANELAKAFEQITSNYFPNNLYLKDILSPYVNLNEGQVDFQIKRIVNGETEGTVIWKGGVGKYYDAGDYSYTTLGQPVNDGDKYIEWVSYSSGVGKTGKQDRVQVKFQKGHNLGNETFQVSYNLKINDTAKKYRAEDYKVNGDDKTDFGKNDTSSGKPGLYSNEEAELTYTQAGEKKLKDFPHPVVQTEPVPPGPPPPPDPGPEPTLDIHKQIESLGAGAKNTDVYRLYLDVTGMQKKETVQGPGIDLVVVIDRSGSMGRHEDMRLNGRNVSRYEAVMNFLNGSEGQPGFIKKFLSQNEKNHLSLVEFGGDKENNNPFSVDRDAGIRQEWTNNQETLARIKKPANDGTHYDAGLLQAEELLKDRGTHGNNTPALLFISDGVPTYYTENDGRRGYRRYGNGLYKDKDNVDSVKRGAKHFIEGFYQRHPGLTTYAVGVSEDIDGTNIRFSESPEVLRYMASQANKTDGFGAFVGIRDDMSKLNENLDKILTRSVQRVVIEDTLSDYVDLSDQPEYLVTKEGSEKGSQPSVIWPEDEASEKCIESFKVDRAKKKLTLTFKPGYKLDENCKYTLSYKVKVSQKAYDQLNKEGKMPDEGEANTDRPGNDTSSGKAGFWSNKEAYISYAFGSEAGSKVYTQSYPHPVVQTTGRELPKAGGPGRGSWAGLAILLVLAGAIRWRFCDGKIG